LRHGPGGGRVADTESHAYRQRGLAADPGNFLGHLGQVQVPGPGDALERNVIQVAAGKPGHLGHARIAGGRREQKNQVHAVAAHKAGERLAFLRGIIHHQHPVHARLLRLIDEAICAHRLDRIGIAHQHHRRGLIARAKLMHQCEHAVQAHPVLQGTIARALDYRAVGHRVGERHAQLDHVRARLDQRMHQRHRHAGFGIARSDKRNECLPAVSCELLERGLDAGH
jgi:hypothetical protein